MAKTPSLASALKQAYRNPKACPVATQDIHVNLKNRNHAIKDYGYGPLNPESQSRSFWQKKAEMWDTDTSEARKARCKNCAAFIQTPQMLKCIADGIENEPEEHESYADDVIAAANLGYCELFHFKCAGDRTCDAWLVGGPVK